MTVDECQGEPRRLLDGALGAAREARDDGLRFVVAPQRRLAGGLLQPIGASFVAALYPFVEGVTHEFGPFADTEQRRTVVELLAELHAVEPPEGLPVEDPAIPKRAELESVLDDRSLGWGPGPFADGARRLVTNSAGSLRARLATYDRLDQRESGHARSVVTHGEPHPGNVIMTSDGPVLVDWDTARLAPPERGLWRIVGEDPSLAAHYERATGRTLDATQLHRSSQWRDLCDVSLFVDDLRRPHDDTSETRVALESLLEELSAGH